MLYKTSIETRAALINAAGILCSQHGLKNVNVSDIAHAAGVRLSAVNYHFGSKEGLLKAVLEYATEDIHVDKIARYMKENEHLFDTRDGCRQMVSDMINHMFVLLYRNGHASWVMRLLLRETMTNSEFHAQSVDTVCVPISRLYEELFMRVTGNKDVDTARCWAINIASGAFLFTTGMTHYYPVGPEEAINYSFFRRLQHSATVNALHAAGLE